MDEENFNWDTCIFYREGAGIILEPQTRKITKNEIKSKYEGNETVLKDYHNVSIYQKHFIPFYHA